MVREAFNKGFEKKWMICEDGGIFKGPQGRHSDRIGDVTIGQIIIADAETYDPDNKIIWRLVDPTPGGWIYAPVRGPKTAVPMTEETLKIATAGTTFWKVKGKKGTIVRAGQTIDSEQVQIIPAASVCHCVEEKTLEDGKERIRITVPCEGWVTKSQVDRWYLEAPKVYARK